MTHELKTPISVSYAAVDALLNFSNPVNEKQKKYLTIVKDQLIHLTGLVEQILTLAVREPQYLPPAPRNHLIKRVGELPHRAIQTESEQTRGVYLLHPRGYRIGGRSYPPI